MAVIQEQIDQLDQAIADGVRQVTIGDQTTTWNTTDSLIKARDDLQAKFNQQQAAAAGRPRPTRTRLFFAGRGY